MTARTKKEFRVLLLPWSVAILLAFLSPLFTPLIGRTRGLYVSGLALDWKILTVGCIFVACLAMAAMSFGVEIHSRTFGLMLVQPVPRSRIWWSKTLLLTGLYVSVGAAFVAGQFLAGAVWGISFKSGDANNLLVYAFLLAGVMCSSAFWTLQLRSVIGGMVLPVALQLLLAGVVTFFVSGRTTNVPEELASSLSYALGAGAVVYCVLFMYLGWRKFSRFEWREGFAGESSIPALPAISQKRSRPAASRGPWASLLRKELRLHHPVFFLALLFVVFWLAALGLNALRPDWKPQFETVFAVILFIYMPLAWLLSGCISLGEEKQLGIWGWHLTLPVSGARQWVVKISFALLVALILGILLPALVCPAANAQNVRILQWWSGTSLSMLMVLVAVCGVALGFWSVAMFGSTVRAVLFSFLGALVLLFGARVMPEIGRDTMLFQWIWKWIIVKYHLPPYHYHTDWVLSAGKYLGLLLLLVLLLRQSYVYFRREPSRRIIARSSLALLFAFFLPLWLGSDIRYTCSYYPPRIRLLTDNLGEALAALPASLKEDAAEKSRPISFEEVDRTGVLSPDTGRWLRGSNIRLDIQAGRPNFGAGRLIAWVRVTFPGGRYFDTIYFW